MSWFSHRLSVSTWRRGIPASQSIWWARRSIATYRIDRLLRKNFDDKVVKVQGTIRTVRKQKQRAFAAVSDGSTARQLQAILTPEQAAPLGTGDSVELVGVWQRCPPGLEQTHELLTSSVEVIGAADPKTYPLQKKYHSPEFLRTLPHLRLRTPFNSQLLRFRSECIWQISNFFRNFSPDHLFTQVQPPLITSSDCEGAGEVFNVSANKADPDSTPFFRDARYLTVSSQLHLEAFAAELGAVWALSPTFRAEKSDTPRHLSEFYMLEAEVNFITDLEEVMNVVKELILHLIRFMQANIGALNVLSMPGRLHDNLKYLPDTKEAPFSRERTYTLDRFWQTLISEPWIYTTYTEAIEALKHPPEHIKLKHAPDWFCGLPLEHEKALLQILGGNKIPVFVTDYPKHLKPFYMAPSAPLPASKPSPPGPTVANFDLLFPDMCEIVGGSLREHRLDVLVGNMRQAGLVKKIKPNSKEKYPHLGPDESLGSLEWYADLRRWGTAPHGGFGLGFDRLIAYFANISSLRDVVAFPRYYQKCEC